MPIPWLTVLQAVPWTDVLNNAPKVAEGAKKLWKTIGKKSPSTGSDLATESPAPTGEPQTLATMHSRLLGMEAAQADLHNQLLASSELIQALAEQNALLIGRAEMMRVRVFRLQLIIAAVALIAVAGLGLVLTR